MKSGRQNEVRERRGRESVSAPGKKDSDRSSPESREKGLDERESRLVLPKLFTWKGFEGQTEMGLVPFFAKL